ncbi:GNAT family N-acetyltransferase [Alloalcanivorax xenomutans]|uniref:GNAT family N-acetyltransferase n=1 Tax=Alloalcanivorax xenomutans TaxID=1094342 RepID=UPI0011773803|nr:GNAT family N-acetyltransferase [Alloalcanivorax xenomutans]
MNIRTANKADAADIARIHVDTWRAAYTGIVPEGDLSRLSKADREKRWAKTLSESANGTHVAVGSDGLVVSWTSFAPRRDSGGRGIGELYAIYLDHSHWGEGIGRELMDDAVSLLHYHGFTSITLWVLQENSRTRAFYAQAGFSHDGASKVIEIDGKELVELRYRKAAQQGAQPDAFGAG